ncbi:isochorismatase family protein [Streptomyces sp. NPDC091376]|uniref:isochorismatase family protein n=1 Tax=Streptomyces sp. NPDC091376 TaxID=3365994 RepID=UPI0037FF4351
MSLPAVAPYPMPHETDVPPSAAHWSFDPTRAALVVLDMQRYSVGLFLGGSPVEDLLRNVAALRQRAGELGIPVVFCVEAVTRRPGRGGPPGDLGGVGLTDPASAALVEDLLPRSGDHIVEHTRPNAFLSSRLERVLRANGRDQMLLCGLFAQLGVLLTAADAVMHGIQTCVVADAVADMSADGHDSALRWAARHGAAVAGTSHLLRAGD